MDYRRLIALALALFVATASLQAVEYETVTFEEKRYTVCRVDLRKEKLQLFLNDPKGPAFRKFSVIDAWLKTRGERLAFAMNAGMYHGDMTAVGLFVAEGKEIAPLNLGTEPGNFFLKPNGVFLVTDRGEAKVVESSLVPKLVDKLVLATQSGPMLVIGGKLHPAFKADSVNALFRNGVGVRTKHDVIFVISEDPVIFHSFARLFRDQLGCPDALFFDGTVSSLHSTALKRSDFRIDLGPIIAVTEPAPKEEAKPEAPPVAPQ